MPPEPLGAAAFCCYQCDAPIAGPDSRGSDIIVRLRQIGFRSQVKIVLALAVSTAFVLALLFLLLWLGGAPVGGADELNPFSDIVVALIFAAAIALVQLAALALLRLLPWPGPRLEIEGEAEEDRLRRVFE